MKHIDENRSLITGITIKEQQERGKKILDEIVIPRNKEYERRKKENMNVLKEKVSSWSKGIPLEGNTKEELNNSIKNILWDLGNELELQAEKYYNMIDELDIPED